MLSCSDDMHEDAGVFAEKYYEPLQCTYPLERLSDGELYLFIPDMEERHSVWRSVINEFVRKYHDTDRELLLILDPDSIRYETDVEELSQFLDSYSDSECFVSIYSEHVTEWDNILCGCDYFISNRLPVCTTVLSHAEKHHIKHLSGVDRDIFPD